MSTKDSARHHLARLVGVGVSHGMKVIGRQSTALPGYVAERISPEVLKLLMQTRQFKTRIIVTGTNGKTTTTHLINQILRAEGKEVITNGSGSNLSRGVITTLLSKKHHNPDQVLVLEVDEATMPKVCAAIQPTHIVVLNILRDQLDRYGEVDTTQQYIIRGIKQTKAQLILCADDPWVASLSLLTGRPAVYFGIDSLNLKALPHDKAADVPVSPKTRQPYTYSHRYFSHLGQYAAQDKSFIRPAPQLSVRKWQPLKTGGQSVSLAYEGAVHEFKTKLNGVYSLYNIAAAVMAAVSAGSKIDQVLPVLESKGAAFGRQETLKYGAGEYQFFLIKNPAGFNQIIQSSLQDAKDDRPLVIVINDQYADGRDVSWLWDVAIEDIKVREPVYVAGTRAYDMALRLEYAGIGCLVVQDSLAAMREAAHRGMQVRVLPTYTALLELRKKMALNLEHAA